MLIWLINIWSFSFESLQFPRLPLLLAQNTQHLYYSTIITSFIESYSHHELTPYQNHCLYSDLLKSKWIPWELPCLAPWSRVTLGYEPIKIPSMFYKTSEWPTTIANRLRSTCGWIGSPVNSLRTSELGKPAAADEPPDDCPAFGIRSFGI